MSPRVRFEDEADAEYRHAGRWYEGRRPGLGLEFFDAVDAAIRQIVDLPRTGARVPRLPVELVVRRHPVKRFPYHIFYLEPQSRSESSPLPTTVESPGTGRVVYSRSSFLLLVSPTVALTRGGAHHSTSRRRLQAV